MRSAGLDQKVCEATFVSGKNVGVTRLKEPRQRRRDVDKIEAIVGGCLSHSPIQVLPGAIHAQNHLIPVGDRREGQTNLAHDSNQQTPIRPAGRLPPNLDVRRQPRANGGDVTLQQHVLVAEQDLRQEGLHLSAIRNEADVRQGSSDASAGHSLHRFLGPVVATPSVVHDIASLIRVELRHRRLIQVNVHWRQILWHLAANIIAPLPESKRLTEPQRNQKRTEIGYHLRGSFLEPLFVTCWLF